MVIGKSRGTLDSVEAALGDARAARTALLRHNAG